MPGTPFAVGVTASGPSRFVVVDLRDGRPLAAPLTNEVQKFQFAKMSPDGLRLAAVDWSGSTESTVWELSVLKVTSEEKLAPEVRLMLSELNAGGRWGDRLEGA